MSSSGPNDSSREGRGKDRTTRERLIELHAGAYDSYDQMLFRLSGGALGLSFVFTRQFIADDDSARLLWALGIAWVLWIVSLICTLWSHSLLSHTLSNKGGLNLPYLLE